ncbi:dual specificity protein phosphatase, putative [Entamoeba invadens IP1]|uniref:protein-tyrosine-phosphatase n=1 Tax=Entamoeba invadens IP1 TaxID=370355 RepID=A0A0A1UBQ0_ENTIV|nr:dual specificity protein phosphatase, putative [Entamoeba invadens IP1]ELP92582.1 dual specificity protein phosphatase, putative [Entamoeba invadens IP1]|eukprot:XP_004259353.1 dual specificity protein phosphatase, putative [Entamoeba invadens IP1]
MQIPITSFFKPKPKTAEQVSLARQLRDEQIRQYELEKQKQRKDDAQKYQIMKTRMDEEEMRLDSYEKTVTFRRNREKSQRQNGIGCQVTPLLYLGSVESSNNQGWLDLEEIKVIINCTRECSNDEDATREYYRLPISKSNGSITPYVKELMAILETSFRKNEKVLVHSFDGRDRAPALIAAYFVLKNKINFLQVSEIFKQKVWEVNIKLSFIGEINTFARSVGASKERPIAYSVAYNPISRFV